MVRVNLTTSEFLEKIKELGGPGSRKFPSFLRDQDRLMISDDENTYVSPDLVEMPDEEFEVITAAIGWNPVISVKRDNEK